MLDDSAHLMYPIGSNGASQAILDSQALAAALVQGDGVPATLQIYEQQRLPSTAAIVKANRGNGPERFMQLALERAPNGFAAIDDVFAVRELRGIADRYKQLTGMAQRKV